MLQTVIFGLAIFFSWKVIEAIIIDAIERDNRMNNIRLLISIAAIVLWSYLYHIS